ncbi:MAG: leucyl/phenylalanyl-tRNA--protein transferase [Bacteroidales bacterium]|nr:leucyl/phenylalanyl-tRNA--protein transferase [Bacteroidales bacterium]
MPVFELSDELIFPHPKLAEKDGLLAYGGDLCVERLLLAYSNGIFPWYDEDSPIMWWSPNPRMVLFPEKIKISDSLSRTLRSEKFKVTFDHDFEQVIRRCAAVQRPGQHGTWIVPEMQEAYIRLYQAGFAHSAETWHEGKLVGGLYGVSLGRMFFGESMFHLMRDASKVALVHLVGQLTKWDFHLIDAQQDTEHMRSLGGELVSIDRFLELINNALQYPTIKGKWC